MIQKALIILISLFIPSIIGAIIKSVVTKYYLFHRYNVNSIDYTGKQIIEKYLYKNNMSTQIRLIKGCLTDYFSPETDYIFLSESTYNHYSLLSVSVALHEFAHAILFKEGEICHRISIIMNGFTENLCAKFLVVSVFVCTILSEPPKWLVICAIIFCVLYLMGSISIIVREWKASSKALQILNDMDVEIEDLKKCKVLLRSCWITYVAKMISILTLTFLWLISFNNNANERKGL